MKETPLIFSAPMIRALPYKTQTRRFNGLKYINERRNDFVSPVRLKDGVTWTFVDRGSDSIYRLKCPFGRIGDLIWVRETWQIWYCIEGYLGFEIWDGKIADAEGLTSIEYAATDESMVSWRSPIHMPQWASRYNLKIIDIRLERLKSISYNDAIAEGARFKDFGKSLLSGNQLNGWSMENPFPNSHEQCLGSPQMAFANYINKIHGGKNWNLKPTNMWDMNLWAWKIGFKVV